MASDQGPSALYKKNAYQPIDLDCPLIGVILRGPAHQSSPGNDGDQMPMLKPLCANMCVHAYMCCFQTAESHHSQSMHAVKPSISRLQIMPLCCLSRQYTNEAKRRSRGAAAASSLCLGRKQNTTNQLLISMHEFGHRIALQGTLRI